MNPLIHLKKATPLFLVVSVLACFGLSPGVQATDLDGVLPGGNNADGFRVLTNLTTGGFNTGAGWFSLFSDQAGSFNTAFGAATLFSNTADGNTAVGAAALFSNTIGTGNTATGLSALGNNMDGIRNTANGGYALNHNISGDGNTATGYFALGRNTGGGGNTAIGVSALENNTIGYDNTALGVGAGLGVTTANNVIVIGTSGANLDNSCFIGNIHGVTTAIPDAIPVLIDSAGQLGTVSSSKRFKKEIRPMDKVSESLLALKPVTFHYKSDSTCTPQFGLIAEQVAEVNPDLVVRDENGEIYTVRYDAVNAMLLNEFLKEHKKVEEQDATITQLKKDFGATIAQLTARLDYQAAQIRKVSAQLELSKPAPQQVVLKTP
jgi:Chaperone of endosialidase